MSFASKPRIPPGAPPSFQGLTPDAVLDEPDGILENTAKLHNHLVATIKPASATFENVVRPIVDDGNRAACRLNLLSEVLAQLSPDQDVRRAAREVRKRIQAAQVNNLMRHDVSNLVMTVYEKDIKHGLTHLDGEDRHLLTCMRARYVHSGANLVMESKREHFRQMSSELDQICTAAQDTMIDHEEGIWFDDTDLVGVPEDVLTTMVRSQSRTQVSFRKNHLRAVLKHAVKSTTRRRYLIADRNRLPENVRRLSRAVELRDAIARLLGFEHHAAMKMKNRMARSITHVRDQLDELHTGLKPIAQAETNRVIKFQQSFSDDDNGSADLLYDWDKSFYNHKLRQVECGLDLSLFAEYFEAKNTLHAMLHVFSDLFGMRFQSTTIPIWHYSVVTFEVWSSFKEDDDFLGYFYADLFQREGKYRGAHCIGIQPGFVEQNGLKHYPATALVCSYANPSEGRPTLLQHSEVTTMFHELGHAIHNLVSRTKYSLPRPRDFSEIPSIMLENWTWVPDVLIRIGKHYTTLDWESAGEGILPSDLVEAVCAKRSLNRANTMLSQVWPAMFDLVIHMPSTHEEAKQMDTTDVWNTIRQKVSTSSGGDNPQDWGAGQARFIHMFRHNDAGYFAYPLSRAYAADLFAFAFAQDPMNAEAGRKWRYQVLEPGASLPGMEILKNFLGREPNVKAIIEEIKGTASAGDPPGTK